MWPSKVSTILPWRPRQWTSAWLSSPSLHPVFLSSGVSPLERFLWRFALTLVNVVANAAHRWRILEWKRESRNPNIENKMLTRSSIHSLHLGSHFLERRLCMKLPTDPASALRLFDEGCTSGVSEGGWWETSWTADTFLSCKDDRCSLCILITASRCAFVRERNSFFGYDFLYTHLPSTTQDSVDSSWFGVGFALWLVRAEETLLLVEDTTCWPRIFFWSTSADRKATRWSKPRYVGLEREVVKATSKQASGLIPDLKSSRPDPSLKLQSCNILWAVLWTLIYFSKSNFEVSPL